MPEPNPHQGFDKVKSLLDGIRRVRKYPDDITTLEGNTFSIIVTLEEMRPMEQYRNNSELIEHSLKNLRYALKKDIRQAVNLANSSDSAKFMEFLNNAITAVERAVHTLPL